MDCPACDFDAGETNFCPECGKDLRGVDEGRPEPGFGPECGTDAGDANFCPECGERLADAPPASAPLARAQRAAMPAGVGATTSSPLKMSHAARTSSTTASGAIRSPKPWPVMSSSGAARYSTPLRRGPRSTTQRGTSLDW